MSLAGNQVAVLVGCNYPDQPDPYRRYGCINDVNAMSALLRSRFQFEDIVILKDEPRDYPKQPTELNIRNEIETMIQKAGPNANLFFYFSGNGTLDGKENQGIPAIVSGDLHAITANDFLDYLNRLKRRSPHAIFTFVCDSSYSGGLFNTSDQTVSNVGAPGKDFGLKTIPSGVVRPAKPAGTNLPVVPPDNGILLSSSQANQESVEVYPNSQKTEAYGAFSNGIQIFLNAPPNVHTNALTTNQEVVGFPRGLLGCLQFTQQPDLCCTVSNRHAPFLGPHSE